MPYLCGKPLVPKSLCWNGLNMEFIYNLLNKFNVFINDKFNILLHSYNTGVQS